MIRTLLAWSCFSAVLAAQTAKEAPPDPPTVSVCEVLAQPLQFDGLFLKIRDIVRGTNEGSWLVGDDCPGVFVTEGHVWPSLISLEAPGNPFQLHPVDFQFNFESQQKLAMKYEQLKRRVGEDCIAWTYTGVFETRKNLSGAEAKTIDPSRLRGFGHLNAAPGQLILKSADDVTAIPNCTPKPKNKTRVRLPQ